MIDIRAWRIVKGASLSALNSGGRLLKGKVVSAKPVSHTPGPWKAMPFDMSSCRVIPEGNQFFSVASVSGFSSDEAVRNAELISAAPELLTALFEVVAILQHELENDPEPEGLVSWHNALNLAEKAIDKANGVSKEVE